MLTWSLLATILCLFSTANGACDNCEGPLGPYCCKAAFRGTCCEYPLSTEDLEPLSPLDRHTWMKSEDMNSEPPRNIPRKSQEPPSKPNSV